MNAKLLLVLSTLAVASLGGAGCVETGGHLGDNCSSDSDCADDYTCVQCSGQNSCYFVEYLRGPMDFEYVCRQYGIGTPTDPRYSSGGGDSCESADVWTCVYDGQATPICQSACIHTGDERTQTCAVLESFLESGDASECCRACP
jgi:hypothetical protein